jgi:hypothetical protein
MADQNKVQFLDRMPLLVLENICEHLADQDIRSFSLVNSVCCSAAARGRFRCLNLWLRNKTHLNKWESMLAGANNYLPLVRRVNILPGAAIRLHPWAPFGWTTDEHGQRERDTNEYCAALVPLLQRLRNLNDMYFLCDETLPRPLLVALQEYRPKCRLCVSGFSFRGIPGQEGVLPVERELATSPNLHSIHIHYIDKVAGLDETVMRMANGAAPNLKHVSMRRIQARNYSTLRLGQRTVPIDPSFLPDKTPGSAPKGALQTLFIHSDRDAQIPIDQWAQHTNLAVLKSLHITGEMTIATMDVLVGLARNNQFRDLDALTLSLVTSNKTPGSDQVAIDRAAVQFLELIPPKLSCANITGFVDEAVPDTLLSRHGPTLRDIQIQPIQRMLDESVQQFSVSAAYIDKIVRLSPYLTDLHILIRRSEGDAREVAAYRALGRLPHLRRLTLDLECSQPDSQQKPQPAPVKVMQGATVSIANIRRMFINAAVDEDLVLAIRKTIASPTLEALHVEVSGAGNFGTGINDQALLYVFDWISRGWVCAPNVRTGRMDVDEVQRSRVLEARMYFGETSTAADWWFGPIWKELWPESDVDLQWRWSWVSSPLAKTEPASS